MNRSLSTVFPQPVVVNDVVVAPLTGNKFGVAFQTSHPAAPLVHLRGMDRHDIATRLHIDHELRVEHIEVEKAIYAGVYYAHFGHFVAECMHRLYARSVFAELKDCPVYFHSRGGRVPAIPTWMQEIFGVLDVPLDAIRFINVATSFRQLHIPAQARLLAGETLIERYADVFPASATMRTKISQAKTRNGLYISRIHHRHSGSYFGESYIENLMLRAGYDVVYPERESITHMLELLSSSKHLVFAEGSAIHLLELLGRTDARVVVVGRRSGTAGRFGPLLRYCAPAHIISEHIQAIFSLWPNEPQFKSKNCCFVNVARVVQDMETCFGHVLGFKSDDAAQGVRNDLLSYVLSKIPANDQALRLSPDERAMSLGTRIEELREIAARWAPQ